MSKKKGKKHRRHNAGRKQTRRRRARVSGVGAVGVSMNTLAGLAAGAVASKALNGVTKNIKFLNEKKWVLPIAKVTAGFLMVSRSPNQFVQDMGGGFIADGVLQGLEALAPNVFNKLTGDGPIEGVGTTYIDLDNSDAVGASGSDYWISEDHSVGATSEDYSVGGAV